MATALFVKKLSATAVLPKRATAGSAGYDLASAYACTVPAHNKLLVKTDLAISMPSGVYGRIAPRSGLALKYFLDVGAGVVDQDYTGNVGVVLFNHSDTDFAIAAGDRVAQLILEHIATPEVIEVPTASSSPDDLDGKRVQETTSSSSRGSGGFGSTGLASAASSSSSASASNAATDASDIGGEPVKALKYSAATTSK